MGRYVARRMLQLPGLILGITLVVFALMHLTPGSPIDDLRLDPTIKPEDLASLKRTLGIDRPLPEQYIGWITQVAQGDLGISLKNYRPVRVTLFERVGNTLILTVTALIVAILVSVPLGVIAALRRNSWVDYVVTILSTVGEAIPGFWLGLLFILLFSVQFQAWGLPWLPSTGVTNLRGGGDFFDRVAHLIMPVTVLAVTRIANWTRYVRAQMLEVLGQDYVRTARAKGLREGAVISRHAFRNASLPLITLFGLGLPSLVAGATITETVFSWPGTGSYFVEAASNRDYTVVMGCVLFFAVVTVLSNLFADIAYGAADPRVKYS